MNFNDLIKWIADGASNWEKGVALYNHFGPNINLKNRFRRLGPVDYNRALLREELTNIARILEKSQRLKTKRPNQSTTQPIHQLTNQPLHHSTNQPINQSTNQPLHELTDSEKTEEQLTVEVAVLPVPLRKLHFKKGQLFNEASRLHKQLEAAPQHKRAAMVETIVENMRENQKIWDELKHYQSKRKIKGDHPDLKQTEKAKEIKDIAPEILQKTLTNRRSNISRYKKLIKDNPNHEKKNENRQAKIDEWTIEIKAIEETLSKNAV
jgi:hypothetical protein